ncbi:methyltransferase [Gracilinema caldarium]|uniref:Methyltransferase small n=1 Tax=Gracilinema caldarium (strain ATCC 51460 / DSM 7334 / H1) TaxID=744872 RepID=F8F2K0_GRAC1|nr:methyltransferase [Gracilinema caldarium]AEJ19115.1 methyltransferase small [Gracilinema caldarium DSM 7334]
MTDPVCRVIQAYGSKTVPLRFKGVDISLHLSHGLFSSYDVDTGTRLLLRVLSHYIDEITSQSRTLPRRFLDAGSGTGVIGIALGTYFLKQGWRDFVIRAQDRDELAHQFTACNGMENSLGSPHLSAHTEALLYDEGPYDWIISNIPAKAGLPVLEYFVRRSLAILDTEGTVFMVIVEKLAETFKSWIIQAGAELIEETQGPEHRVFVYRRSAQGLHGAPYTQGERSFSWTPYIRHRDTYKLLDISYPLQSLHGVADFDTPHFLNQLMATLSAKMKNRLFDVLQQNTHSPVLFFEPDQGHFPLWFRNFFYQNYPGRTIQPVLAGRNILALEAAKQNLLPETKAMLVPAIDPDLSMEDLRIAVNGTFPLIFLFPEIVPQTDRWQAYWTGLEGLMETGSIFCIGTTATEADRFDRIKRTGFQRLGDIKRQGYRVLAYQKL